LRTVAARDHNEPEIVAALRKAGYFVTSLSGGGVPDLLVIKPSRQVPVFTVTSATTALSCCTHRQITLLEVKQSSGKLTPAQVEWHNKALNRHRYEGS